MPKVMMRAPNGQVSEVDSSQVAHYESLGAVRESQLYDAASVERNARRGPAAGPASPRYTGPRQQIDVGGAAINALPMLLGGAGASVGGMAGAPFGGVGAIPGGAIGGAAGGSIGEALRQLVNMNTGREFPMSGMESLGGIGGEAALQGAFGAGGVATNRLMTGGANALMRRAIRPTPTMNEETAVPVWETAVKERVGVKDFHGRKNSGTKKSGELRRQSSDKLKSELAKHGKGKPYTRQDVVHGASPELAKLRRGPFGPEDEDEINALLNKFVDAGRLPGKGSRPGKHVRYSASELNELKQELDAIAEKIHQRASRGNQPSPNAPVKEEVSKALAGSVRSRINQDIPQAKAINERTQRLINLNRSMRHAESVNPPVPGINPLTWGPEFLSGSALNISHPMTRGAVQITPRMLAYALYGIPYDEVEP